MSLWSHGWRARDTTWAILEQYWQRLQHSCKHGEAWHSIGNGASFLQNGDIKTSRSLPSLLLPDIAVTEYRAIQITRRAVTSHHRILRHHCTILNCVQPPLKCIYTLMVPFSLCWRRWYILHIHHFAKWPIFYVVSEWNTARPSWIIEHHVGSARKSFTSEITLQLRRASSLKFQLSLCTGDAMFFIFVPCF